MAGYQPGAGESLAPAPMTLRKGNDEPDYDLAIIGSGSAGFATAIEAREQGARVIMVERAAIGGTCVNIGCVPSKALLRAAEAYHTSGHHPFAGIHTCAKSADLDQVVAHKNGLVEQLREAKYSNLIAEYDWELMQGEARFTAPDTLLVGNRTIRAAYFLIASGAKSNIPPIPGLDTAS
jgi:mercuric reductase